MYLIDTMSYLLDQVANREVRDDIMKTPIAPLMGFTLAKSKDVIQSFDCYTFERSALIVASDLRVDKPAGLEAVAELILQTPRKIYMESDFNSRNAAFSRIPSVPVLKPDLVDVPVRVGIALNIFGEGRGEVQVAWTLSQTASGNMVDEDFFQTLGISKRSKKPIRKLMSLNWSAFKVKIDINKRSKLSFEEFKKAVEAGDDEDIAAFGSVANLKKQGVRQDVSEKQALQYGYNLFRLNSFCEFELDPAFTDVLYETMRQMAFSSKKKDLEDYMMALRSDLDGEVLFAIALAGALEIDDLDVGIRKGRPAWQPKGKKQSKLAPQKEGQVALNIVNMRISKDLVSDLLNQGHKPIDERNGGGDNARRKPVRHAVRGHLFRARNGKIVYRKPHWRGSAMGQGKIVHRVF